MDATKQDTRHSKFLSLVLRHEPAAADVELDEAGWVGVEELLKGCARHGHRMSRADLERIVATNAKQRFAFSDDGTRIRANQGHSVEVELGLPEAEPPAVLYHGTVDAALGGIFREGIRRGARHDVHLSPDVETATKVGSRRGKPVILSIDAAGMRAAGHTFRVSANGVWLTAHVPPEFVRRA